MGSLPNLHELCSKEDQDHPPLQRLGHCQGYQPDRNKLSHVRAHPRVTKSKSNGNNSHIHDDFILEQLASYSPISNRSSRNLAHNVIRRRDSMNSSIGATSVRRLITVVRNTHGRYGPVYNKKLLIKNLLVVCASHVMVSTALYPFLALQGSVSVWNFPFRHGAPFMSSNVNVGSLLLAALYLFGACSALLGPSLVHKFGSNAVLFMFYVVAVVFYASHFYPALYLLVPAYIACGLALGPVVVSRITFLMTLSSKLSYTMSDEDEDSKNQRRTCIIRRVARSFQFAQDLGLIIGSLLTALIISYTFSPHSLAASAGKDENATIAKNMTLNAQPTGCSIECASHCLMNCLGCNCTAACLETNEIESCACEFNGTCQPEARATERAARHFDHVNFFESIFDANENGERLCGSNACASGSCLGYNTSELEATGALPPHTVNALTAVYVALSLLALVVAALGLDRIRLYVCQDPLERPEGLAVLKSVRDSFKDLRLQLAAPLALFIGVEQAFMFADFSKSYVMCTLGVDRINLVFLCMGLLQSLAACTLSMLLRTIQRYIVIAVGFAFHGCLLMVQLLWKPSGDDPALFYVISAAWGVCNAIWEMLNFTLLTRLYSDNWEPAFSNSTFFRHLGMALAYGMHGFLCNWIKVYFIAALMLLATIPYTWLEIKLENIKKVKNISRL